MIENIVYGGTDDSASGRARHRVRSDRLYERDEHDVMRHRADGAGEGIANEAHGWQATGKPGGGPLAGSMDGGAGAAAIALSQQPGPACMNTARHCAKMPEPFPISDSLGVRLEPMREVGRTACRSLQAQCASCRRSARLGRKAIVVQVTEIEQAEDYRKYDRDKKRRAAVKRRALRLFR